MQNNNDWRTSSITAGWTALFSLIGIFITSIIVIWLLNWDWSQFIPIYKNLWYVFVILIPFIFFLTLIFTKFPKQSISIAFLSIASLLLIASMKGSEITASIRGYIDTNFELNYIAFSLTIFALLISFIALYKNKRRPEDD